MGGQQGTSSQWVTLAAGEKKEKRENLMPFEISIAMKGTRVRSDPMFGTLAMTPSPHGELVQSFQVASMPSDTRFCFLRTQQLALVFLGYVIAT